MNVCVRERERERNELQQVTKWKGDNESPLFFPPIDVNFSTNEQGRRTVLPSSYLYSSTICYLLSICLSVCCSSVSLPLFAVSSPATLYQLSAACSFVC